MVAWLRPNERALRSSRQHWIDITPIWVATHGFVLALVLIDTVNTASRMESTGEVGQVNIRESAYALVKQEPVLMMTPRGKMQAKGNGEMEIFYAS